jgi:hypothetical protein
MKWVTHRSLHDPNFSLEKGYEADDDFHRVPKSGVQEAGQCLPEGQGHLFRGIAKQLREADSVRLTSQVRGQARPEAELDKKSYALWQGG